MMETLRSWLTGIVIVTLLLSVLQTLVPEGSLRQIASFTGGLVLLAALAGPAAGPGPHGPGGGLLPLAGGGGGPAGGAAGGAGDGALRTHRGGDGGIYIGQGSELGVSVTARVETRTGEDGVPVPWSADLTGRRSAALEACLAEDLGIPAERQVWHERETEN